MSSSRTRGWRQRLTALVIVRLGAPFAWGANDCCSWAADAVQAQHEQDTLAALRVPRGGARDALRAIRAAGGARAGAVQLLGAAGLDRVPPALASTGDLLLLRRHRRQLLALCNGDGALAPGECGLVLLRGWEPLEAWRP